MILGQDGIKNLLKVAVNENVPALLVGETGTGKTSLIRELATDDGKDYARFSITGETTVDDFVGKYVLKDGETVWQDGMLLSAAKKGSYLVVDEINAALPEILFVLHSLLDDDKYIIVPQKDNSTIKPHKDFRFFATMNPVDEYAGTKELNKAFHSRFGMVIDVKYPNRTTEVNILIDRYNVDKLLAQKMVDVAIGVRKAKQQDKVFYTLSTRDLLYWAALEPKLDVHSAFQVSIRNKAGEDGKAIDSIYSKVFTDWKKAEEEGILTTLESIQAERKQLDIEKKALRPTVLKEVKADLSKEFAKVDKEKLVLTEMENRVKEAIKLGMKLDNPKTLSDRLRKKVAV